MPLYCHELCVGALARAILTHRGQECRYFHAPPGSLRLARLLARQPGELDPFRQPLARQVLQQAGERRVLVDLAFEPDLKKFICLGDHILGKEIGGPLQAHIHKGRGHAGQESGHPALVDVAHGTVLGLALDVKLRQASVFEKSHPGVPFGDADQQ